MKDIKEDMNKYNEYIPERLPINRVEVVFSWHTKKMIGKKYEYTLSLITVNTTEEDIIKDNCLMNRVYRNIKKKAKDINIKVKSIKIISNHGETTPNSSTKRGRDIK